MKKKLCFFFILVAFISMESNSQANVYHPFPDSNAVWVNWWSNICSGQSMIQCNSDYQYVLRGDTVISGQKYAKLYSEGWWSNCVASQMGYTCSTPVFGSNYYCGIRNDSANKKVYFITGGSEALLYDFQLNLSDTIKAQVGYGSIITKIDSIAIGGSFRKRFITSPSPGVFSIIEGVGLVDVDTTGGGYWAELFMGGPCICPTFWAFSCFWQDGVNLYGDTSCSIINSVKNYPSLNNDVAISPNPANQQIQLKGLNEISSYYLVNYLGKKLREGEVKDQLDVSTLPNGIYFLMIGNIQRFKVVIQH